MAGKAEQKERTRESILRSAARILRTSGVGGARVADVMKGAGLTVGGFYAHFQSKDELVDATLRASSGAMRSGIFANLDDKDESVRAEVVLKRYLSAAHRDEPETGCPFPATIGEIATTAPQHREVLAGEIDVFARELGKLLAKPVRDDTIRGRQLALALFALMVGGLSVARALRGTELSDEILRACRAFGRAALRPEGEDEETRRR